MQMSDARELVLANLQRRQGTDVVRHCQIGCTAKKIFLVLFGVLVKVTPIMKRIYTLVVLLGLAMGMMMLTGCNKDETGSTPPSTNAPSTTTTNK